MRHLWWTTPVVTFSFPFTYSRLIHESTLSLPLCTLNCYNDPRFNTIGYIIYVEKEHRNREKQSVLQGYRTDLKHGHGETERNVYTKRIAATR